jgi:hypothetical protein
MRPNALGEILIRSNTRKDGSAEKGGKMNQCRITDRPSATGNTSSKDLAALQDCDDTRREIASAVARLLLHYRHLDLPASAQEMIAEDWLEDLSELHIDDVRFACREWRQTQPYRPTPADIRLLAIAEHRRRNPIPEPPYIPPSAPREHTAEEVAEVERKMLAWRHRLAETVKHLTERHPAYCHCGLCEQKRRPKYEDPDELRRARIELGLEDS